LQSVLRPFRGTQHVPKASKTAMDSIPTRLLIAGVWRTSKDGDPAAAADRMSPQPRASGFSGSAPRVGISHPNRNEQPPFGTRAGSPVAMGGRTHRADGASRMGFRRLWRAQTLLSAPLREPDPGDEVRYAAPESAAMPAAATPPNSAAPQRSTQGRKAPALPWSRRR
jgi:hypothetical protein